MMRELTPEEIEAELDKFNARKAAANLADLEARQRARGRGDWIQVASGGKFWPLDPRPEEIFIEDIANALSLQCRFCGHVKEFYSVGQHSVLVSQHCEPKDALWGLLHDASEAYLSDVSRPVKNQPAMKAYREAEARLMKAICSKFGLPYEMPASVKAADEMLLATEARDLMAPLAAGWRHTPENGYKVLPEKIKPWSWDSAISAFLREYDRLHWEANHASR